MTIDPFDTATVGDLVGLTWWLDLTSPVCAAQFREDRTEWCSRTENHEPGQHVAVGRSRVVAVWPHGVVDEANTWAEDGEDE